jgi:hypothetical protein
MTLFKRINLITLINALLINFFLLLIPKAQAQGFPEKAIQLLAPFPAGSITDNIARLIAQRLSDRVKQPVVMEPKLGAGGVVRDPALRRSAVLDVAQSAYDVGLGTMGIAASPLPGPAGNVEYFLWLRRGAPAIDESALDRAIEMGPA